MSSSQTNQKAIRVVDGPAAEVYANKVIGVSFDGGALVATLAVLRFTPDRIENVPNPANMPSPTARVCAHIALSPAASAELANMINGTLQHAQAQMQSQIAQAQGLMGKPRANNLKI